jgi:cytoskeletal protein RodZ
MKEDFQHFFLKGDNMKNEISEKEQEARRKGEEPSVYAIILVVSLMLGVLIIILKVAGLF